MKESINEIVMESKEIWGYTNIHTAWRESVSQVNFPKCKQLHPQTERDVKRSYLLELYLKWPYLIGLKGVPLGV